MAEEQHVSLSNRMGLLSQSTERAKVGWRKEEGKKEGERLNGAKTVIRTELRKSLRMWFGEFCSCCCLSLLPQPAYYILATSYKDFFSALYTLG